MLQLKLNREITPFDARYRKLFFHGSKSPDFLSSVFDPRVSSGGSSFLGVVFNSELIIIFFFQLFQCSATLTAGRCVDSLKITEMNSTGL